MNNEPVAWYKKNSNDYLIENIGQPSFQVQEFIDAGYIPLYTHPVKDNFEEGYRAGYKFCAQLYEASPVKELTEDMLWEFAEKFLDTDAPWGEANVTGIGHFIEAILRKAQE